MARVKQGGTKMWCADCGKVVVCEAFNPSLIASKSGQRFYMTKHDDVHFFRRGRRCLSCDAEFLSAELREDFVDELIELRNALAGIKRDAETYVQQSAQASTTLNALTQSLEKLRALKVYKEQKV